MRILVDSSVWIDFFNGADTPEVELLEQLLGREPLLVGDLILAEVLQGFRELHHWHAARDALLCFPVVEMVGREVALDSARNYRTLRSAGITVRKTIDSLIATWCLRENVSLLHSDRDFEPFARHLGLRVVHAIASAPVPPPPDSAG